MIDMHIHTTHSDGIYTTEQVLYEYVHDNKISTVSITDHDTFDGQLEACKISKELNLCYVVGIEFSTNYQNSCVHVLGYFSDMPDVSFQNYIKNKKIIECIKQQRKKELAQNQGYYDIFDIVKRIHENHGIAILAHPVLYKDKISELLKILDGAECIYPAHNDEFIVELLRKCNSEQLFCTAGTDLHDSCNFESYKEKFTEYFGEGVYEQKIRNWYSENLRGEI